MESDTIADESLDVFYEYYGLYKRVFLLINAHHVLFDWFNTWRYALKPSYYIYFLPTSMIGQFSGLKNKYSG